MPRKVHNNLTLTKELDRTERQMKAAELYKNGLSMAGVAKELGVSSETVHRDLHGLIEKWRHDSDESIREWRAEHIRRTEEMYIALSAKIADGNTWAVKQRISSIRAAS
jgi:DNA-binding NarL/FixJ family response regulator